MLNALKSLGEGRVGGYLVVWGNPAQKDLQNEYFTPQSELGLDWYDKRPVLYHHGLDQNLKATVIGTIDTLKADQIGVWAEAQLLMHNKYVEAVLKLVQKGVLGWSSGSLPHLVNVDPNGHIRSWPIVEGSLTPTPAEPRRTDVHTIKSAFALLGLDTTRLEGQGATAENVSAENAPSLKELCAKAEIVIINTDDETAEDESAASEALEPIENQDTVGGVNVNIQDIIASVIQAITATGVQLTPEQQTAITQAVTAACGADASMASSMAGQIPAEQIPMVAKSVGTLVAAEVVKINRQKEAVAEAAKAALVGAMAGQGGQSKVPAFQPTQEQQNPSANREPANNISMRTKYADLSAEDMSYMAMFEKSRGRVDLLDSKFMREFGEKAGKAYEAGKVKIGDKGETARALKSLNALKSDELSYSTLATSGDEWVPDLWANQIWELARLDNVVFPQFKTVEMPSNPFELPVQSTDPTVYYVGETKNESALTFASSSSPIPDSKMGTTKVTLTAGKLALRSMLSAEVEEDSIIPFISELRTQSQRSLENAVDNVLINGDTVTSATTNINLIDGTPTATDKYLIFDGIRKVALLNGSGANATSGAGGAVTLAQIRTARALLLPAYYVNPENLFILTHAEQYIKFLGLSEFITMDKAGPKATAQTGQIGVIDGMPVLVSAEYAKTDSAGKIPAAGGTLGSLCVVYKPGWVVGFRRHIKSTLEFVAGWDMHMLTATMRIAAYYRDNDAASILYNSLV